MLEPVDKQLTANELAIGISKSKRVGPLCPPSTKRILPRLPMHAEPDISHALAVNDTCRDGVCPPFTAKHFITGPHQDAALWATNRERSSCRCP